MDWAALIEQVSDQLARLAISGNKHGEIIVSVDTLLSFSEDLDAALDEWRRG